MPPSEPDGDDASHLVRGLRFDTGMVEVDPETAPEIVPDPDPSRSLIECEIARLALATDDPPTAIRAAARAVIHDPENTDAYDVLSAGVFRVGLMPEAIAACRSTTARDPERVSVRERCAVACQAQTELSAAAAEWAQVLRIHPEHPTAHGRRAVVLYFLEDYRGAWEELHAAEARAQPVPAQFRGLLCEQMDEP